MTSDTQLRTSSGRVIATFTTWAPPQSWPTRCTGPSKRSNSATSHRRYSSTVAVNRAGTGAPKPGGDRRTTGPRSRSGANLFQTAAVSGLPWTRHTVTRFSLHQSRTSVVADRIGISPGRYRYALLVSREIRYGHTLFQDIAMSTGAPRDVLSARLRKLAQAGVLE